MKPRSVRLFDRISRMVVGSRPVPSPLPGALYCAIRPQTGTRAKSRSSLMFALLHPICSLLPLFPRDPLAYVGGAMEDGHAGGLTTAEESHHLYIYQRHLVEVQHCPGAVALYMRLQCLKMLCLNVADQPERCVLPVRLPFNLACHLRCLFPVLCAVHDR